jgi:hypothetical protein
MLQPLKACCAFFRLRRLLLGFLTERKKTRKPANQGGFSDENRSKRKKEDETKSRAWGKLARRAVARVLSDEDRALN